MKLKIAYRQNLKMSPGKIAAQSVHAALALGATDPTMSVVVLGYRDKKYHEVTNAANGSIARVHDAGYTEVDPGTETCAAWYETN